MAIRRIIQSHVLPCYSVLVLGYISTLTSSLSYDFTTISKGIKVFAFFTLHFKHLRLSFLRLDLDVV